MILPKQMLHIYSIVQEANGPGCGYQKWDQFHLSFYCAALTVME